MTNKRVLREGLQDYINTSRGLVPQEMIDSVQSRVDKLTDEIKQETSVEYLEHLRRIKPALDQHQYNFYDKFANYGNPKASPEYNYQLSFGGQTFTIEFTPGSIQIIEQLAKSLIADAIDEPQPVVVPVRGFETLIDSWTYRLLTIYGRDISYEKYLEIAVKDGISVQEPLLKRAYDFACDLYDDNESNGNNDEMYPNRKR